MRTAAVLGSTALLALLVPGAGADTSRVRGPYLLVSLPAIGTVTWRCDNRRPDAFALQFSAFTQSATDVVRLRAGGRTVVTRQIHPGQRLRLPFLTARVQRLDVVQATGAGTLRASVVAEFLPGGAYCFDYLPPRLTVRVEPRR